MTKTYISEVNELKDDEVFVFGSNWAGFHGAGAAGFASFNKKGNIWRKEGYDKQADGWRGCWNIKGVGVGYQEGYKGASYALPTVISAGKKRSMTLPQIRKQIVTFRSFALGTRNKKFFVAQGNQVGYNGYTPNELRKIWFEKLKWPNNVLFNYDFAAPFYHWESQCYD